MTKKIKIVENGFTIDSGAVNDEKAASSLFKRWKNKGLF